MLAYIIRRILYAVPILICVNILVFLLFFFVNTPDHMARAAFKKNPSASKVYKWKRQRGYHLPTFLNTRDTIIYVAKHPLRDDVRKAFSDYRIQQVDPTYTEGQPGGSGSNESAVDAILGSRAVQALEEARKIGHNSIVVVDSAEGLTPQEAAFTTSRLLSMGVTFVTLQREEGELPPPFRDSVIVGYDLSGDQAQPRLTQLGEEVNALQKEGIEVFTRTIFFEKSVRLFWFDFGKSDNDQLDISSQILARMGPSLSITVPSFFLGLSVCVFVAMISAYCRGNYVDRSITIACIAGMSIVSLFYYFSAQYGFSAWLKVAPVSGYAYGLSAWRFVMLPIAVSVIAGLGGTIRYYRTLFLEEINRDYVKTARSKGMTELRILFKHVLKNAMIPILTGVVMVLPALFVGGIIIEAFFGIPGLGGFTLEGIQNQDFRILGSMVYLGTFIKIVAVLLTDLSYTLVDLRVKLS